MTKKFLFNEFRKNVYLIVALVVLIIGISYSTLLTPYLIRGVVDEVILGENYVLLFRYISLMMAATLLVLGLKVIRTTVSTKISNNVVAKLRTELIKKCLYAEHSEVSKLNPALIVSRITNTAGMLVDVYLINNVVGLISESIFLVIVGIAIMRVNIYFSLGLFILMPIFYLYTSLSAKTVAKVMKDNYKVLESGKKRMHHIADKAKKIRLLSGEEKEMLEWDEWTEKYKKSQRYTRIKREMNSVAIGDLMINFMYILIFGLGSYLIFQGEKITLGELILFITLCPRFFSSFNVLLGIKISSKTLTETLSFVDEIMELSTPNSGKPVLEIKRIELKNVTHMFSTDSGIQDVSFTINKGETVGVVGVSGGGKSTIIDLLLGFISPNEGELLVNGVSLRDINTLSLRKSIALVEQFPLPIKESLKETMIYPNWYEETEFKNCLKKVKLEGKLASDQSAYTLSGGEQQRLALASSIYRNPSLLLLDEFTSALDPLLEGDIMDFVYSLKDKLVLIVSHRIYTLMRCDKVIVIDDGKLVEAGNPNELSLNKESHFYKLLHKSQVTKKVT